MDNIINKISLISKTLKSKEIIDYLSQWNIDKMSLLKLVIESKIGYDQLSTDPDNSNYFKEIEESSIYETSNYSQLILVISTLGDTSKNNIQHNNLLNKFYLFHKMLFRTANLVSNLLTNHLDKKVNESMNNSNSIVNPLFASNNTPQPSSNPNVIINPLNQSKHEENNYLKTPVNYSEQMKTSELALENENFLGINSISKNSKESSKMFMVKEELPAPVEKTTKETANENGDDVSLGTFLKSLSGF